MSDRDKIALINQENSAKLRTAREKAAEAVAEAKEHAHRLVVRAHAAVPDPAFVLIAGAAGWAGARVLTRIFGDERGKTVRLILGVLTCAVAGAKIMKARQTGKAAPSLATSAFYFGVGLVGEDLGRLAQDLVDKAYGSFNK